ncbi:MAG: MBL fold metallo-hydrolase [Natrialbaceae archaeon]|nr:MBL fold metallo-hydrolase [Natrialbaceae archaeon]
MSGQFPELDQHVQFVTAETLKARLDDGEEITLLDTRRPADFEAWHIEHPNIEPVNVPFTEFLDGEDPASEVPAGVPEGHLVTCCAKGISSAYVAEFLTHEGQTVEALEDGMRGWARLYEAVDLREAPLVRQYYRPSSGCLSYLVASGDAAVVIDPLRAFTDRYVADVEALGARLEYAMDTHVHADHVSGVRALRDRTGAEVVLPRGAVERGLDYDATLVSDGEALSVGKTTIEVAALPGHTTEMTGYVIEDLLVGGDSLFLESVARPDLEDAERAREAAATLYETVQKIAERSPDDRLAPGHAGPAEQPGPGGGYTATIRTLQAENQVVDMDKDTFVTHSVENLPPRPSAFERIDRNQPGDRDGR